MLYLDFNFGLNNSALHSQTASTFAEITAYITDNPPLKLGIDGTMPRNGADPRDRKLTDRRIMAVRDALLDTRVADDRIQIGALGDPLLTRDRRGAVSITTR